MQRHLRPALAGTIALAAVALRADVIVETNQIHGTISLSNTNPEIISLLQGAPGVPYLGLGSIFPAAASSPPGFGVNGAGLVATNHVSMPYRLDTYPGTPASGVTYSVAADVILGTGVHLQYTSADSVPQQVTLFPRSVQPDGVQADLSACVSATRFKFGYDAACTQPATVNSATFYYYGSMGRGTGATEIARARADGAYPLTYQTGTDSRVDTLQFVIPNFPYRLGCDVLTDACIQVPTGGAGGGSLGSAATPFEVREPSGDTANGTYQMLLYNGPNGNRRYSYETPTPAQVSAPATWAPMPNLLPGNYDLSVGGGARTGYAFNFLSMSTLRYQENAQIVSVSAAQQQDLHATTLGQLGYPFVMHPAYHSGAIVLAEPYATSAKGGTSVFASLMRQADTQNSRGVPTGPVDRASYLLSGNSGNNSSARSSFPPQCPSGHTCTPTGFDPATGLMSSSYETLLLSAYDLPDRWSQGSLQLVAVSEPAVKNSIAYFDGTKIDPADYPGWRQGSISFTTAQGLTPALLNPGDRVVIDHKYCFNEVTVGFQSAGTLFANPVVSFSSTGPSFSGTDFLGRNVTYSASGAYHGTPATGYANSVAPVASTSGQVVMALPQGTYNLAPSATTVGNSTASFPATSLTVGCGQQLDVVPGLSISLAPLKCAADDGQVTIAGKVNSGTTPVDHIWYTLNGGAPIDICASGCGASPSYSQAIQLAQICANSVRVFASAAPGVVSATDTITWDDPRDGVVCGDGSCGHDEAPPTVVFPVDPIVVEATGPKTPVVLPGGGTNVTTYYWTEPGGPTLTGPHPTADLPLGPHPFTVTGYGPTGIPSTPVTILVTVVDHTPPELNLPPTITAPAGTPVPFHPTATDLVDGPRPVDCDYPSGYVFPLGTTTVTCTSTDTHGNPSPPGTFNVFIYPVDSPPCDPRGVALAYAPGERTSGLVLFEDNWPARGDTDFNDQTVSYNYVFVLDANGNVSSLEATFNVLSVGALIHNGLYLHLPVAAASAQMTLMTAGSAQVPALALDTEELLTVQLSGDTRALFERQDEYINTMSSVATQAGHAIRLVVRFNTPMPLDHSRAPFDLFIARTAERAHEIHLAQFAGTSLMDQALFGTAQDGSAGARHFVDDKGLPYALAIPQLVAWPLERVTISKLYPNITDYAMSGGTAHADWYATNVDSQFGFSAGLGNSTPPAPAFLEPAADALGLCQ